LAAPGDHNIGAPVALGEIDFNDFAEVPSGSRLEELKGAVASFLVNMCRGENVELPRDVGRNIGVSTWRELNRKFLDPEASLLSAQIVELKFTGGYERLQARVVVTGIAEGIPFARLAVLGLLWRDGLPWVVESFSIE
jgi:hypothetical protein